MTGEELLLDFLSAMSRVRTRYRRVHIELEKRVDLFKNVETTVSFAQRSERETSDPYHGLQVSIGLDASLKELIDDDKHSAGVSITVYYWTDFWSVEADIGYSSYECGWDGDYARTEKFENATDLISGLQDLAREVLADFRAWIDQDVASSSISSLRD